MFTLLEDVVDPGKRVLAVSSFAAMIPSFTHSAVAPGTTGENTFPLDPDYETQGSVDTTTGAFSIRIRGLLENDHYTRQDTVSVVMDVTGTLDVTAGTFTATIGGFTIDDGPPFNDQD